MELANPLTRLSCLHCERGYWAWKSKTRVLLAIGLALAAMAFVINLVVQLTLWGVGFQYDLADRSVLFEGVPAQIRCPECGSANISHSLLQPLERLAVPFNPMAPHRCWGCWERFWVLAPPLNVALAIASTTIAVVVLILSSVAYCRRKNEVRSWLGRAGQEETRDWTRIYDPDEGD